MARVHHIAIVGGSGSGKTWLAGALGQALGALAARVSLDDFYRDLSALAPRERAAVNFDDPAAIDWPAVQSVLAALSRGEPGRLPVYDFATHTRRAEVRPLAPGPLVIWDGLWLLHEATLRPRFADSVFLECAEAERLARRLARDVRERGRSEASVRHQFEAQVQPMHTRFVEPQRAWAHRVLASPVDASRVEELARAYRALAAAD